MHTQHESGKDAMFSKIPESICLEVSSGLSSLLDVERSLAVLGFRACPRVPGTCAGRVAIASAMRTKGMENISSKAAA